MLNASKGNPLYVTIIHRRFWRAGNVAIKDNKRSFGFTLLALFVFCTAGLANGCSGSKQPAAQTSSLPVPAKVELPGGGPLIEQDDYELVNEMASSRIHERLPKLNLAPLPKTAKAGEFEIRLWTDQIGLVREKLIVIRTTAGNNSAQFFDIAAKPEPISVEMKQLPEPRSGWNKFIFELRSRLTTPKGLTRDPNFPLERDEGLVLLEALDREQYSRVLYGQNTTYPDGKRLIGVCGYLADEFAIDFICTGERKAQ